MAWCIEIVLRYDDDTEWAGMETRQWVSIPGSAERRAVAAAEHLRPVFAESHQWFGYKEPVPAPTVVADGPLVTVRAWLEGTRRGRTYQLSWVMEKVESCFIDLEGDGRDNDWLQAAELTARVSWDEASA